MSQSPTPWPPDLSEFAPAGTHSGYDAKQARAAVKLSEQQGSADSLRSLSTILAIIKMTAEEGQTAKTLGVSDYFGKHHSKVAALLRQRGFGVEYAAPGVDVGPEDYYKITW